jgi:hypothetical protein
MSGLEMAWLMQMQEGGRRLLPGILLSGTVAAAASFLGAHYEAPTMLFALLLGMAFNFLHVDTSCRIGVDFAAKFPVPQHWSATTWAVAPSSTIVTPSLFKAANSASTISRVVYSF